MLVLLGFVVRRERILVHLVLRRRGVRRVVAVVRVLCDGQEGLLVLGDAQVGVVGEQRVEQRSVRVLQMAIGGCVDKNTN